MNTQFERLDRSFAVLSTDEAREILGGGGGGGVNTPPPPPPDDKDNYEWVTTPASIEWP